MRAHRDCPLLANKPTEDTKIKHRKEKKQEPEKAWVFSALIELCLSYAHCTGDPGHAAKAIAPQRVAAFDFAAQGVPADPTRAGVRLLFKVSEGQ